MTPSISTPTRQFSILIDPDCLHALTMTAAANTVSFVRELGHLGPPVLFALLVPPFQSKDKALPARLSKPFYELKELPPGATFTLNNNITELESSPEMAVALNLLTYCEQVKADALVTLRGPLIKARYSIYQHHRIHIVPLEDFGEFIELCAHGHGVFWSVSNRNLTVDVFYQMIHWKNSRLAQWFHKSSATFSEELRNNLRTALLLRYAFLIYAKEMTQFYTIQKDHCFRRGLMGRYAILMGYHLNTFYFHVWGMLEQLTLIAKDARQLTLKDKQCGIRKGALWNLLKPIVPGLYNFVHQDPIAKWIDAMSDIRHLAAHRELQIPLELVEHTAESQKSDEEILQIARQENAEMYHFMPSELVELFEPQLIYHWRMSKMKIMAPNVVVIEKETGGYFRSPIISLDFDLNMLNAIIDAFLVGLFKK